MTHLFKLKKDGQTVGYVSIDQGIHWSDEVSIPCNPIDFDTAHAFVTEDKNGKDVFGDDSVWFHWTGKKSKGKIIKEGFFWKYESAEKYSRTLCVFDISHIELIEEKPK